MICTKNAAEVVGGKTTRACDSCIKKRARWYCAADEAFLCQSCDATVHSANPLARRHERVRLKTASIFPKHNTISSPSDVTNSNLPSWHHGFTRKPRTPRGTNNKSTSFDEKVRKDVLVPDDLVPEVGNSDEFYNSSELYNEDEQQLLLRVPIFDPFVSELCTSTRASTVIPNVENFNKTKEKLSSDSGYVDDVEYNSLNEFLPSDIDLAEFAADVESLLGRGLENGSFGIEELGLMNNCKDDDDIDNKEWSFSSSAFVKVEEEEGITSNEIREWNHVDDNNISIDLCRDGFELSFDYDSQLKFGGDDIDDRQNKMIKGEVDMKIDENDANIINKKRKLLNLDYDAIITQWTSHRSPWTTGGRPNFDIDERWPEYFMGPNNGRDVQHVYNECAGIATNPSTGDGGREARVSRYREKRRTRLFSKKIRYEVRKLNAEKRPRMKGRFVKRTSFAGPPFASNLLNK